MYYIYDFKTIIYYTNTCGKSSFKSLTNPTDKF